MPFFALGALVLLLLAGFTRYSATIWSDYSSMVQAAAYKAPQSSRAQGQYAVDLYNAKRYEDSLQVISAALAARPESAFLQLTQSTIRCELGLLTDDDLRAAAGVISAAAYDPRAIELYTAFSSAVVAGKCPAVDADELGELFQRLLDVPENADPRSLRYSQIQYFIGFLDVHSGRPDDAFRAFEASLASRRGAGHAMMMAAVMASNNYHVFALQLSDIALAELARTPGTELREERVRESDILEFQATVREDMAAAGEPETTD